MNSRLHHIQPGALDAEIESKKSSSLKYVPLKLVFTFAPSSFCLYVCFLYFSNLKLPFNYVFAPLVSFSTAHSSFIHEAEEEI